MDAYFKLYFGPCLKAYKNYVVEKKIETRRRREPDDDREDDRLLITDLHWMWFIREVTRWLLIRIDYKYLQICIIEA